MPTSFSVAGGGGVHRSFTALHAVVLDADMGICTAEGGKQQGNSLGKGGVGGLGGGGIGNEGAAGNVWQCLVSST